MANTFYWQLSTINVFTMMKRAGSTSRKCIPLHATLAETFVNADFVVRHNQQLRFNWTNFSLVHTKNFNPRAVSSCHTQITLSLNAKHFLFSIKKIKLFKLYLHRSTKQWRWFLCSRWFNILASGCHCIVHCLSVSKISNVVFEFLFVNQA